MPASRRMMQEAGLFAQETAQFGGLVWSEFLSIANGQLEGRTLQVIDQYFEVIGVDVGVLRGALEEIFGMLDDVLIERRARSDQNGQGGTLPTSSSAGALPGGSDRAWIAGHYHCIQRPDIDSELERVGGDHCPDFALSELSFDLAALAWQIAAAISADPVARQGSPLARVAQILQQNLGRQPAVGEYQRLLVALDEFRRDAAR